MQVVVAAAAMIRACCLIPWGPRHPSADVQRWIAPIGWGFMAWLMGFLALRTVCARALPVPVVKRQEPLPEPLPPP